MNESFAGVLAVGGKSNSLGRSSEVVEAVLADRSRLSELYDCMYNDDAWLRMRAADSFEKICRQHPDWIEPFADQLIHELAHSSQPSIQWHLAQIYQAIALTPAQQHQAVRWLIDLLSSNHVDWIVAANAMDALVKFSQDGLVEPPEVIPLLRIQQRHKSPAVVKRATKHLLALRAS